VIGIVPRLSGIRQARFSSNRVPIAVNVGVDSVEDVLGRINNSGAGVVASIETASAGQLELPVHA